ncbi:hypothetical protein KRMM14A1004_57190 [Krasilnikovia sp. MM14-A1004]
MDCNPLLTVSNFAAVVAITADSACVWATPDVTPLPRLGLPRTGSRMDRSFDTTAGARFGGSSG